MSRNMVKECNIIIYPELDVSDTNIYIYILTSAKNSVIKSSGPPTLTDTSSATSSSSDWA